MSVVAIWYRYSPEGQRFLEARELRTMLAAAGVLAAYALLRTRRRFPREAWRQTACRWFVGVAFATTLWLGVDWVRGENWIEQLVRDLPDPHENGVRYSVLIASGWIGWVIAVAQGLRWGKYFRQSGQAEERKGG